MNPSIQPTQDDIARQAQRLWQERGCPEGQHEEIWLEAEDQLTNSPFGAGQKNNAEIMAECPDSPRDSSAGSDQVRIAKT